MKTSLIVDGTIDWTCMSMIGPGAVIICKPILSKQFPFEHFATNHYVTKGPMGWAIIPVAIPQLPPLSDSHSEKRTEAITRWYKCFESFADLFSEFKQYFKFYVVT